LLSSSNIGHDRVPELERNVEGEEEVGKKEDEGLKASQ